MALHSKFPQSPHAILNPDVRWFPADETRRETSMDKLMPPPRQHKIAVKVMDNFGNDTMTIVEVGV